MHRRHVAESDLTDSDGEPCAKKLRVGIGELTDSDDPGDWGSHWPSFQVS